MSDLPPGFEPKRGAFHAPARSEAVGKSEESFTIIFVLLGTIVLLSFFSRNNFALSFFLFFITAPAYFLFVMLPATIFPRMKHDKMDKLFFILYPLLWSSLLVVLSVAHFVKKSDVRASDTVKPLPVVDLDKFGGWDMYSDGYTWNAAPESEKRDLCRRLAQQSRIGNGAGYFYDGLNAFYGDVFTRSTKLEDATRLLEAGGNAVSFRQRSY